jgi:4-hydroxy-tetrahydrodipicolinate synthase
MSKFKGLGVAMVTPFKPNGDVDFGGLEKLTNHMINGGVDYLVVQGTTGESATLSAEEKRDVLQAVVQTNAKRVPIVYGIGGNNTRAVTAAIAQPLDGVDGILSVSPYYNKPTQGGIFEHYKSLDAATHLPIILYNVPGRTGSNVLGETTLRIADSCENIVAVKEASGNMEQVMGIINRRKEGFSVLSGDDAITLPLLAAGADGIISVVGNALPKHFSEMVHAAMKGDMAHARKRHYELLEIIQLLFIEGNPAGVKEVLAYLGICGNTVRLPLLSVSSATKAKLIERVSLLS